MPSNLNQPGESAPYRVYKGDKKKKKNGGKEEYIQLGLPIRLSKMKKRTNNNVNEV